KFNYFDFGPGQLDTVIEGGFGKGIRTNGAYAAIATWMKNTAEANSRPGDFAIAEEQVPMTYMLIQRRPALNHSWTGMANSPSLRREAMAQSLAAGRRPQIAYRFIFQPMMFPEDVRAETFIAAGPKFFSNSDPVDSYIVNNMTKVDTFKVNNIPWVEVYTAKTRSAGER
ncbi:MAG: hypothetical protein K2Q10_00800, partial [Rhodospirillales bacterium]|nr:hypothetical protein [Rhodospirillales bacterium]